MIKKLKQKFKEYTASKSTFSIISDVVFVTILIAFLIPATRQPLVIGMKKLTMSQPRIENKQEQEVLNESDYLWDFQKADGEFVHFADYKGKVVFLTFWATYCPSCVAEFPSVKNLFDDYKDQVHFLLISSESPAKVTSFLDKEQYDIPFYLTFNKMPDILTSRLIPATYIIAKDGRIVLHKTGSAKWDGHKVRSLLDALIAE